MTRTDTPLIRATAVTKQFPDRNLFGRAAFVAIKGVDLHIDRGETLVLVGESGSGKSTLGRILVRLDRPSTGSVWLDGVDISRLRGAELRKYRRRAAIAKALVASQLLPVAAPPPHEAGAEVLRLSAR